MTSDPGALARWLWRELAPESWPLPASLLPPGTALVGGAVRDGLLGRLAERPDLDLVVVGDAIGLARTLAGRLGGSWVVLDRERSIARLVLRGWTIDLARCAGGSLEADLRRRDYTVNAIALRLAPAEEAELVDPLGGLADLEAARLVAISEANLLDDPLRLLRGIRLATELAFDLSPQSWDWIRQHHQRLGAVAGERVLAELERLAAAAGGERGLAQVLEAGLLEPWGGRGLEPALGALTPGAADVRGLTAEERDRALPLARLATVLNGEALTRMPLSRRLEQRCRQLRHWQGRITGGGGASLGLLAEPDRLRMQQELEDDLPALLLALDPAEARGALARWRDRRDPLFHPRPPLDGRVLQERLGIAPGPLLGRLIHHLTQEQAFGRLEAMGAGQSSEALEAETLRIARQWLGGQPDRRRD